MKQSSDKLPQSSWIKPGEKPIKLTPAMRVELSRAIGEKNVRVLETNIGFAPKREKEPPQVDPMFRYETAWQRGVAAAVADTDFRNERRLETPQHDEV